MKSCRGIALIELLAVTAISAVLVLSISRFVVFLFNTQDITNSTNRLVNEGGIIINEILKEVENVKPDTIVDNAGVLTLTSSSSSMTLEIIDNGNNTYEINLNGVPIQHSTTIANATLTEVTCVACPPQKLYKLVFELSVPSGVLENDEHTKWFVSSFSVFRGL